MSVSDLASHLGSSHPFNCLLHVCTWGSNSFPKCNEFGIKLLLPSYKSSLPHLIKWQLHSIQTEGSRCYALSRAHSIHQHLSALSWKHQESDRFSPLLQVQSATISCLPHCDCLLQVSLACPWPLAAFSQHNDKWSLLNMLDHVTSVPNLPAGFHLIQTKCPSPCNGPQSSTTSGSLQQLPLHRLPPSLPPPVQQGLGDVLEPSKRTPPQGFAPAWNVFLPSTWLGPSCHSDFLANVIF